MTSQTVQPDTNTPAPQDLLEHVGKCGTLIIASSTSMMEPLVALIGYARAKGLLDQIIRITDEAVGAAAGAVKADGLKPFAEGAQDMQRLCATCAPNGICCSAIQPCGHERNRVMQAKRRLSIAH